MRKAYRGHKATEQAKAGTLNDLVKRMDKIDDYLDRVLSGSTENQELLDFGLKMMQMPDGEDKDFARAELVQMIDQAIEAEESAE
jgi:hypothetical protein